MTSDGIEIVDVFLLNERFFSIGGIWPLKPTYLRFGIYATYYVVQLSLLYVNLYFAFGDLERMVDNMTHTLILSLALPMSLVIRFRDLLAQLILESKIVIANDGRFESNEERWLYFTYNHISKIFTKVATIGYAVTAIAMYFKPLPTFFRVLLNNASNNSEVLDLPFHTYCPEITNVQIYALLYVCQAPIIYMGVSHVSTICLLVNLVLHLCGELSILSHRIRNLEAYSKKRLNEAIRKQVQLHLKLIEMSKSIENVFHLILLVDVTQTSTSLGLSAYITLTSTDVTQLFALCTFMGYATMELLILYGYCFIGEQLMQESRNITNAYYQCDWQEMPRSCQNSLLICMLCTQNNLRLSAGKFYTFSLSGFTGIVKTSMAYVSMLRTLV